MSSKIAFIDLDGTLLTDEKTITPRVKETIKKLDDSGIPVILTSGRMPAGIKWIKEELELNRPIIAFGGGLVLDEDGKILYSKGIKTEEVEEVINFIKKNDIDLPFNVYTKDNWVTSKLSHPMEQFEVKVIDFAPEERELDDLLIKDEMICKGLFTGYEEEIDKLQALITPAFPDLQILKSQYFILEIMNKHISKATGMEKILNLYGLKPEEAAAFGDGANDIEMLEYVGNPIAMKNSAKIILDNPNFKISTYDNNHNGLAIELEREFDL